MTIISLKFHWVPFMYQIMLSTEGGGEQDLDPGAL